MEYDVIVIGSGPGGYVAAIRLAQLGVKTVCIEKSTTLGGTCLNVGCIPSKALLSSSEMYQNMKKESASHGLKMDNLSVDLSIMMQRKEGVVSGFTKGIESLFKKNKIDRISGFASFKDRHTVVVAGKEIRGKYSIIATGSEPQELPFLPFDEKKILSSTGALSLSSIPKKMVVIGGGVIGVELGSVYNRLGSEVRCIEFLDRICPSFDGDLSAGLQKSLMKEGMIFHLSHRVLRYEKEKLIAEGPQGILELEADVILVAVGRKPYTQGLGLENVGIVKNGKGFIEIDASFRTSQPNIFAIGDVVEGAMLAHKASEEGVAVAELIAGHKPTVDYLTIPNVIYTHPEVASVGFSEEELKAKKIPYKLSKFPFKANSRARCIGLDDGFVKMIADPKTHRILGVHILGEKASELIGEAVYAIAHRGTADDIGDLCHAHPTLSESLKEAALSLFKAPIHM